MSRPIPDSAHPTARQVQPTSGVQSRRGETRPRALLVGDARETWGWLEQALAASGVEVQAVGSGAELQRRLEQQGPVDLVVTAANLADGSGLSVLAHARSLHIRTPFVVVLSSGASQLRVMISDAAQNVLSSRVVDPTNLVNLALTLVGREQRPPG